MDKAKSAGPSILLLDHIEALAQRSDSAATGKSPPIVKVIDVLLETMRGAAVEIGWPVVLMGTTVDEDTVPGDPLSCFKQDLYITVCILYFLTRYTDRSGPDRRGEICHYRRSLSIVQFGARRQFSIYCHANCCATSWRHTFSGFKSAGYVTPESSGIIHPTRHDITSRAIGDLCRYIYRPQ